VDFSLAVSSRLSFPYKKVPLPDGNFDWLPIVPVQLSRSTFLTTQFEAIADTGAFDCLFHADIAEAVGIKDITTGIVKPSGGIVKGLPIFIYGHEVRLVIGSDNFKIQAFFSTELSVSALLGRNGFFDKYIVTFDPSGDSPSFSLSRLRKK
jgi:hypothetical protein